MEFAKRPCLIFQQLVRLVLARWWQSVAKSRFGTGLTEELAFATLGGKAKVNGIALGRALSLQIGRRLSLGPRVARSTSQMCELLTDG
jgi:hypothetical protein